MDFAKFALLAATPAITPAIPPEIQAGMEAALARGPLAPYERRSIGEFSGIPRMERIVETLCEGLHQHGLRVVFAESGQMDGRTGLAITRL